jgi:3-methyladenine DNA glycosylase AlkD
VTRGAPQRAGAVADSLQKELRVAGSADRAEHEKRYLKSSLEHYGVPVPTVRSLVKRWLREPPSWSRADVLDLVDALWRFPVHECRLAAALVLEAGVDRLTARDTGVLEKLIRESGTWALVDVLSGSVAGRLLLRHPDTELDYRRWSEDEDQWVRRSGVLAFLQAVRREEHVDRYLTVVTAIVDPLLEDPRFFVRKAIGWVLRDAGRRRPEPVFSWLLPRADRVSGLTLREAARHLPPQQREALLAGRGKRPSGSRR